MTKETILPDYVDIINATQEASKKKILKEVAQPLTFPLSDENLNVIDILEAKFDSEENCAGLAAPQLGFGKQVIIFSVEANEDLKKWRTDLSESMPKTIWINPSYQGIGDEKNIDYEACFSVGDHAAPVARFKNIEYQAYLPSGDKVEGQASGFLARVIQHEIDHIHGILFIDLVAPESIFSVSEYRKKKTEAMKIEAQKQAETTILQAELAQTECPVSNEIYG